MPDVRRIGQWWPAVVVATIALVACRGKGSESDATPPPVSVDPPPPRLRFADGRLVVDPASVSVDVPAPWAPWTTADRRLDILPLPGATVAFRHPDGAMLTVVATRRSPGTGSEPTLRDILEDKRREYGTTSDVVWADDRVGGYPVRTLAFTVTVASHDMRLEMWMLGNEAYWVNFICMAPASDFTARERDCRTVVDGFHALQAGAGP